MSNLTPCPFEHIKKDLGHKPYIQQNSCDLPWVQCTCGAAGPIMATEAQAIEAWNSSLKGEVERLKIELGAATDAGLMFENKAKELEAEVEQFKANNRYQKGYHDGQNEQRSRAELRVRPSVEELDAVVWELSSDATPREVVRAIHAMLPPAPKVLTVEEIEAVVKSYAQWVYLDAGSAAVEVISVWRFKATAQAIHKAIYGGGE